MERQDVPAWVLALEQEHLEFIRKFVLSSGSIKDMATAYQVSYPTVRAKLHQLIERIDSVQQELKTTAEELRAKMADTSPEVWQLPDGKEQEAQGEKGVLDLEPRPAYPEVASHPLLTADDAVVPGSEEKADEAQAETAPTVCEDQPLNTPPAPSPEATSAAEPVPPKAA